MNTTLKTALVAITTAFLLFGCNDNSTAKVVEKKSENKVVTKDTVIPAFKEKPSKNVAKVADNTLKDVFLDVAKIGPNGKYMVLVFGTNTCPYCMKLKEDIHQSKELQKRLKNDYSAYYLKTHENLRHKLYHEGEFMDVDTKTMVSIYGVQGTPTLIFTDKKGKAVIMVPGYMPKDQFLATLDFMESGKWEGKDRKNGEVYQALKDFYISKSIKVNK